jgi:hypothetical protein
MGSRGWGRTSSGTPQTEPLTTVQRSRLGIPIPGRWQAGQLGTCGGALFVVSGGHDWEAVSRARTIRRCNRQVKASSYDRTKERASTTGLPKQGGADGTAITLTP